MNYIYLNRAFACRHWQRRVGTVNAHAYRSVTLIGMNKVSCGKWASIYKARIQKLTELINKRPLCNKIYFFNIFIKINKYPSWHFICFDFGLIGERVYMYPYYHLKCCTNIYFNMYQSLFESWCDVHILQGWPYMVSPKVGGGRWPLQSQGSEC